MVAHRTLTPFVRVRILHPLPKEFIAKAMNSFFCCGFIPRFAAISFCAALSFAQKLRLQSRTARLYLPQAAPNRRPPAAKSSELRFGAFLFVLDWIRALTNNYDRAAQRRRRCQKTAQNRKILGCFVIFSNVLGQHA